MSVITSNKGKWRLADIGGGIYVVLQITHSYAPPWGVTLYVVVALTLVALESLSTLMEVKDV